MSDGNPAFAVRSPSEPLDHYADGAWYDAEYVHIRGDIPYYSQIAASAPGPLLELACGTGRLSLPMCSAGATIHGVDLAPSMIARARVKKLRLSDKERMRLSFEVADMRTVRLGRTFGAVVLGFNTIMHMLTDADLRSLLETVRVHLLPGGRFYFDLHTPLFDLLERDPNRRYDPQQMVDPRTGDRYIVTESSRYSARTQITTMRFYYQRVDANERPLGDEQFAEVRLRVLFPRELDLWLDLAGFEVLEDWDDFERTRSFSGRGGRRVVIAARR